MMKLLRAIIATLTAPFRAMFVLRAARRGVDELKKRSKSGQERGR